MTTLIRTAVAALLAGTALLVGTAALAQPPDDDLAARRRRAVEASPRGPKFQVGRQEYQVVTGLRAARAPEDGARGPSLEAAGVSPAAVLERKGPWVVYQVTPGGGTPGTSREVAVNVRTGQLGVVTGIVAVRMGATSGARQLAGDNGLALEWVAASIGYAFLRVPPGGDVVAVAARLERSADVRSVEVEVQEAFAVPR